MTRIEGDAAPAAPSPAGSGTDGTDAADGAATGAPRPGLVRRWAQRTTGGAPIYPLLVLFGLNMVDELDRTAFGILLPEIRDHFGLDTNGILTVVAVSMIAALVLAIPIGFLADRGGRVRIALAGATGWGIFSVFTGLAPTLVLLGVARAGSGLGRAVNEPVHNSLLSDFYDIPNRPRVYGVHRYANAIGQFVGPISAGLLAYAWGWRTPFIVFGIPTLLFVLMGLRLREPSRGHFERQAMGASAEVVATDEESPSFAESWRVLGQVRSLQRVYHALPFIAVSVVGLVSLGGLFYEEIFGLDERQRGFLSAAVEPAQLLGLVIGIPIATKLMARDAGLVLRMLAGLAFVVASAWVVFALAPNIGVAVAANVVISGCIGILLPGAYAVMSLAIPAKVRSFGFAVGTLWILPGLALLPLVGWVADEYSIRTGLLIAAPVFMIGGLVLASAGNLVKHDIEQVWRSAAARSEVAHLRRQGAVKLLLVRGVDVHYDNVQVLFGVDLEVDEGEIVALMGTNGAGKSTLLKSISGLVQASAGAIVFDGRDMTNTPPNEVAGRGVVQVPGGQGVFTQLSVGDNLRLAAWPLRRRSDEAAAATARVLDMFPVLRERLDEPAGNLSGGQQQMLTLGMAFISKPRLLMIDELSLGLAPAIVGQLLDMVRALRDQGTTIILVEQSVNVALTVADRAYFMEKGEIRFEGPTAELLERPDLLRSVFLNAAGAVLEPNGASAAGLPTDGEAPEVVVVDNGEPPLPEEPAGPPSAPAGAAPTAGADGAGRSTVSDGPAVLEVRDVTRRFGGVRALDHVSFDVRPGEILGFIGPNGAGKTTLFDVISGYTSADGGTIRFRRPDVDQPVDLHLLPTHRRSWCGVGRSFQDGRLFPGLTVEEAIAVALEQHVDVRDPIAAALHLPSVADSEQAVRQRVDELIDLFGLDAYREKFTRELSTGTRRVVDLACVLAQGPSIVLLDEPSSGIAQREAEALAPLLRRVRDELGASLLVIEHDLPLLTSISDRLIALDLGRVVAEGPPADVVEHPAVVASYLGTDDAAIARSDVQASG